jgi:hypothetical protein
VEKNGHEMQGVVLNILIILLSAEHEKFIHLFGGNEFGIERVKHWILLLERLAMLEEFLKQKSFVTKDVKLFKIWLPQFLAYLKRVVNRQHSVKMKLLKFHLMTHFAGDILKWGIPSAYNSATGESNHKMLKRMSKKTQRQLNLIEEQTGVRYVEALAISRSLQDLVSTGFVHRSVKAGNIEDMDNPTKFSGHSYYLNNQGIYDVTSSSIAKLSEWHNMQQRDSIFTFVKEKILPHIDGDQIMISTRIQHKNVLYHGDPSFKDSHWQDWAYCDWGSDGICPVQILLFLDLTNLKDENIDINGVILESGCKYALIHMIKQPLHDDNGNSLFRAHEVSRIFFKAQKMMDDVTKAPSLACIPIDSIVGPCIAIPCDLNALTNKYFLFLKTRSAWPAIFVNVIKEGIRNKIIL